MKKWFLALFIGTLVSCQEQTTNEKTTSRVHAEAVREETVRNFIETIGNVFESSLVEIRPQVQGILLNAAVKQGDDVKIGDLLYEIDPRPYQAALDEAKATLLKDQAALELAKSTVERNRSLAQKDYISALTFEQYNTNVKTAEAAVAMDFAAVEIAKINLEYCKIFSPIDGKISIYNIYPGNLVVVNDATALTEIRTLSPVEVRFTIPQRDLQEAKNLKQLEIEAHLPYEEEKSFAGAVFFIDNHIDLQTGTILFKSLVPNVDYLLWPGQFLRVRLYTKTIENALTVPYEAIQIGQNGKFVYAITKDNFIKIVPVTTGTRVNSSILVEGDLKKGDQVVTNGALNIRENTKVEIVTK